MTSTNVMSNILKVKNPVVPEDKDMYVENETPNLTATTAATTTSTTTPTNATTTTPTSTTTSTTTTKAKYYCEVQVDTKGTYGRCISSITGRPPVVLSDSTRIVEETIGPFDTLKACDAVCSTKTKTKEATVTEEDSVVTNDEVYKKILQALAFAALGLLLYGLFRYLTYPKDRTSWDYYSSYFKPNSTNNAVSHVNIKPTPSAYTSTLLR